MGLLSRNVKIIAEDYDTVEADLMGFRIIVSDYSAVVNDFLSYYRGFARVDNVEFLRYGQLDNTAGDDVKYGMLLSNIGTYNASRPSYIRGCAFYHGLGTAIGIKSSKGFTIENNIVHHSISYGMLTCLYFKNKISHILKSKYFKNNISYRLTIFEKNF